MLLVHLALPLGSMLPFFKPVRLIAIICGMASPSGIAANLDLYQQQIHSMSEAFNLMAIPLPAVNPAAITSTPTARKSSRKTTWTFIF